MEPLQRDNKFSVNEPLPFDRPKFVMADIIEAWVTTNSNLEPLKRSVLRTRTDNQTYRFYEIGRRLKDAIYGQVSHGFKLVLDASNGTLSRLHPLAPVAIKVYDIKKVNAKQQTSQENPLQELSVMRYLGEHQNIMSPLEVCRDSRFIFLVMNYCEGGELFDLINRPLSEELSRIFFRQILEGLHHLHSRGVAHRDMSLENVLISDNGTVCKIIDFGMSVRLPMCPTTGDFMMIRSHGAVGKSYYIPPEVYTTYRDGLPHNPMLGDIWAMGVMLFMMLTARSPVKHRALDTDVQYRLIREGQIHIMLGTFALTRDAVDLIDRILKPVPEERYTIEEIFAHPWMQRPPTQLNQEQCPAQAPVQVPIPSSASVQVQTPVSISSPLSPLHCENPDDCQGDKKLDLDESCEFELPHTSLDAEQSELDGRNMSEHLPTIRMQKVSGQIVKKSKTDL